MPAFASSAAIPEPIEPAPITAAREMWEFMSPVYFLLRVNAEIPVISRPMMSACIESVPSYVDTTSMSVMWRATWYSNQLPPPGSPIHPVPGK